MDIFNKQKLQKLSQALRMSSSENARLKAENARLIKENYKLKENQNVSGLNARRQQTPNIPNFDIPPVGVLSTTLSNSGLQTKQQKLRHSDKKSSIELVD